MTTDTRNPFEDHATVRNMNWVLEPGGDRIPGIRVGYGNGFCFIPNTEIDNLVRALCTHIDTQQARQEAP